MQCSFQQFIEHEREMQKSTKSKGSKRNPEGRQKRVHCFTSITFRFISLLLIFVVFTLKSHPL